MGFEGDVAEGHFFGVTSRMMMITDEVTQLHKAKACKLLGTSTVLLPKQPFIFILRMLLFKIFSGLFIL